MRRPLALLVLALLLLVAGACGDDGSAGSSSSTTGSAAAGSLNAQVASYDLAAGPAGRFIVGIFDNDQGPVGYGTVDLRFAFVGEKQATGTPQLGPSASGRYIPVPGSPPAPADATKAAYLPKAERGVYAAEVAFERAGIWGVEVAVDLDGKRQAATAVFTVLPKHEVPTVGEAAPRSQNLTTSSPGAPPAAVDSRAQEGSPVPDPALHGTTVAAALDAGRPVLLVVSTPTFCVSQFCGPITEMIADLAGRYGDRASFVHIEVWKDFEAQTLNDSAKEWIARGENINEPWVFLIGGDGTISARWDNVASEGEIEPLLEQLPVIAG